MALVEYTDSEENSSEDDDQTDRQHTTTQSPTDKADHDDIIAATQPNKRKRPLQPAEPAKPEQLDNDDASDEQPAKKKRKKMKLPSVRSALQSPQRNALQVVGSAHEKEKQKEEKMNAWISTHHSRHTDKSTLHTDEQESHDAKKRKQELQHNQREHAKYVKQQMKVLATAEQETKFKRSIQETTREKNRRKQKIGQATFTLKWDRDCGFEMAGV